MKTTRIFLGLVMLCGIAFGTPAPIITTTPTNGPTTITVHARMTDGKPTVGVGAKFWLFRLSPYAAASLLPPTLVGSNGDWTATNVLPGSCYISLFGTNYFMGPGYSATLLLHAGTNYIVDFVLSRGVDVKGRVLDAATGKPVSDARVMTVDYWGAYGGRTDAEGRYELPHCSNGPLQIETQTTNYVAQRIKLDAAAEGSTVLVPDFHLQRGGWISGQVERPAELDTNAVAWINLEFQGNRPSNSLIGSYVASADGAFRTYPLPPGYYSLNADWQRRSDTIEGPRRQTWQASGSVSNINVIAGQDTTIVFIPTKLTIRTNGTGGR